MKIRFALAAVLLPFLLQPASALTRMDKVTPDSTKESGITMEAAKREDGSIGFTVTRYLDKERKFPADSELTSRWSAHLELRNPAGTVLSTIVAGEAKKDTVVYWFALSREAIANTRFSLSEYMAHKDPERLLLGGGTIYEFNLPDFAAPLFKRKPPEHP
ncbi:MAG TPA: hypothetical protein VGB77_22895 [Abditibacteriaceae bacterium]|jgi:hypothetical protein